MKKEKLKSISDLVHNYKTNSKYGFTQEEIDELLKQFPDIHMDKFNDALRGNTCMVIDDKVISYHCDIITALKCGVEDRYINVFEWD